MTIGARHDQGGLTESAWSQSPELRRRLTVVTVGILLVVAAVGASARIGSAKPVSRIASLGVIGDAGVGLVVAGVALGVALLAWALRPHRRPRRGDKPPQLVLELIEIRWWEKAIVIVFVLGAIAGMVAGVVMLIRHSPQTTMSTVSLPGRILPSVPLTSGPRLSSGASSSLHLWPAAAIVAGVVVAGAILMLLTVHLRNRPIGSFGDADGRAAHSVALAARVALDELRAERDPRMAVVRAYAAMERILSQRGLGRGRHEAPFEYLERTLAVGGLPVQAAIELTELFELARFSDHLIARSLRDHAIQALEDISQSEVG